MKNKLTHVFLPSFLVILGIFALYQSSEILDIDSTNTNKMTVNNTLQSMETLDLDDKVLVTEREDKLTVYIDLVGEIDEDNVLIDTEENVVLVSGVTEVVYEQNENDQTKIARAISSYSDSINIPKNIEAQKIQVIETETGVTIILPKSNK